MIKELIEFTSELFPSINPYTSDQIYKAIEEFNMEGKAFTTTMDNHIEYLAQGDILHNIPFVRMKDDGEIGKFMASGVIMANTCDCERRDNILIAPFIPLDKINRTDVTQIVANRVLEFLYLPNIHFEGEQVENVVDFSQINTFNRTVLSKLLESGKVHKLKSLNINGYYLFLIKLTAYLMRPEDAETQKLR